MPNLDTVCLDNFDYPSEEKLSLLQNDALSRNLTTFTSGTFSWIEVDQLLHLPRYIKHLSLGDVRLKRTPPDVCLRNHFIAPESLWMDSITASSQEARDQTFIALAYIMLGNKGRVRGLYLGRGYYDGLKFVPPTKPS